MWDSSLAFAERLLLPPVWHRQHFYRKKIVVLLVVFVSFSVLLSITIAQSRRSGGGHDFPTKQPALTMMPSPRPTSAVLWLHGIGDRGSGWKGQFAHVARQVPGVQFYHPTAPEQPVSCCDGEIMTSWFDIATWQPPKRPIGLDEPDPPQGLDATVSYIHQHFNAIEQTGVPAEKIVVGGFSQGGTAAIVAGLTYGKRIGGIVSISGWATYRNSLHRKISPSNNTAPCMFSCGSMDDVIDHALNKESESVLKHTLGDKLTYMETPRMQHFATDGEKQRVEEFMVQCLTDK